jgi:hypothetical protein
MSQPQYYFLPDVRQGLAADISNQEQVVQRAEVKVALQVEAQRMDGETPDEPDIPLTIQLYGPGDILGFDSRIVARTDPQADVGDFEPNYFPAIEFVDPDFAWRFTPTSADDNQPELTPWITLIALAVGSEFTEDDKTDRNLPRFITVNTANLPDLLHAWRWAHVHITAEEDLSEGGDPATIKDRLEEILRAEPERAVCRLLCPRRLNAKTRYATFVVPTFKLGLLAGRGEDLSAVEDAMQVAWTGGEGEIVLPYYYRWEFTTGVRGDFEHLVRLLEPRVLSGLGIRDIDAQEPGFGTRGVHMGMEGALRSTDTRYTRWGQDRPGQGPEPLQADLAKIISEPEAQRVSPDTLATSFILVKASAKESSTVEFTWHTSEPCKAHIEYSDAEHYEPGHGYDQSEAEDDFGKDHLVELSGLELNHVYHFKISGEMRDRSTLEIATGKFPMPPLPTVVPPIYGRWHARCTRVGDSKQGSWIDMLNLDPRHRAAAGLGAEVIRQQQEALMASAWEQLGEFEDVINLFACAQFGRDVSNQAYRRLADLSVENFIRITSRVQPRVLVDVDDGDRITASYKLQDLGQIPAAALDPAFRHISRPRGPIFRRQKKNLRTGANQTVLAAYAVGSGQAAGPHPKPPGTDMMGRVRNNLPILSQAGTGDGEAKLREFREKDLMPRIKPGETIKLRVAKRLARDPDSSLALRFDGGVPGDPLDTVLPAPSFPDPMYEPLRDMAQDLLLPGVEKIPQNTIGVLATNRRFMEAYMCGLNHEFASELLWRGYPTDQRGSYFRQFWDVSEYMPEQETLDDLLIRWLIDHGKSSVTQLLEEEWEWLMRRYEHKIGDITDLTRQQIGDRLIAAIKQECLEETLKDITPLVKWSGNKLGHNRPENRPVEALVLVIRGDLLRRYPGALIYAVDAVEISDDKKVPKLPDFTGSKEAEEEEEDTRVFPTFTASLPPDLTFLGFPFQRDEACGDEKGALGKFFIIEERVGEPRFGLDVPKEGEGNELEGWENLSWAHFQLGQGQYVPEAPVSEPKMKDNRSWDQNGSATFAWMTWQEPVRVAVHASQIIPPILPFIDHILSEPGRQGEKVKATIIGEHLDLVTSVSFSGEGITTRLLSDRSDTELPVEITIDWDAATGERSLSVDSPAGAVQAPPDVVFVVEEFVVEESVIEGVEPLGDYTIKILLKHRISDLPERLTNLGRYALVCPEAEDIARRPVGTGPFVFQEWVTNDHILLSSNEDYWGKKPGMQEVIFRFMPNLENMDAYIFRQFLEALQAEQTLDLLEVRNSALAQIASQMGLNVIRIDQFYKDKNVFMILGDHIRGDFIGPHGLYLEFLENTPDRVVYLSQNQPAMFDPLKMQDTASLKIATQVLDGLMGYQPGQDYIVPGLAVSMESNFDGTEWVLYLRQGVTFHDGTSFDAAAVVANLMR